MTATKTKSSKVTEAVEAKEPSSRFVDVYYQELNKNGDYTRQDVSNILKALQATILAQLEENGKALIHNVGRFTISQRSERQGLNPRTQEPVMIPASIGVTFRPSKSLKEHLNA